jgi:hypothetical protein
MPWAQGCARTACVRPASITKILMANIGGLDGRTVRNYAPAIPEYLHPSRQCYMRKDLQERRHRMNCVSHDMQTSCTKLAGSVMPK